MESKIEKYFDTKRVSSSSYSSIDPTQGGHPKKFIDYIEGNLDKKDTVSLKTGSLIHLYIENKDAFMVLSEPKPSAKLGELADRVIELVEEEEADYPSDELIIRASKDVDYRVKQKEETRIKFYREEASSYVGMMLKMKNERKYAMTIDEMSMVDNALSSLQANDNVNDYLYGYKENQTIHKEVPIYFKHNGISKKSLIDDLRFIEEEDRLIIKLTDVKSTSGSINYFFPSIIQGRDGAIKVTSSFFEKYRVYRQLSLYNVAVEMLAKGEAYSIDEEGNQTDLGLPALVDKYKTIEFETYVLPVETGKYAQCDVVRVFYDWIGKGKEEIKVLDKRIELALSGRSLHPMEYYNNNGKIIECPPCIF